MSVLKIVQDGDPVLRVRAQEVDLDQLKSTQTQTLILNMVETMYAAHGVGIAAPQVGASLRIFIADSPQGPIALINPIFTKVSLRKNSGEEGCLSVPGHFDQVRRAKSVEVKAWTAEGKMIEFSADNFFAVILQHELDHLDGRLFVDRVKEQKS